MLLLRGNDYLCTCDDWEAANKRLNCLVPFELQPFTGSGGENGTAGQIRKLIILMSMQAGFC